MTDLIPPSRGLSGSWCNGSLHQLCDEGRCLRLIPGVLKQVAGFLMSA